MVSFYDNESNILLIWDVHLFLNYFVLIKLPYERIITTNNTTEFISNLYDGSYCVWINTAAIYHIILYYKKIKEGNASILNSTHS